MAKGNSKKPKQNNTSILEGTLNEARGGRGGRGGRGRGGHIGNQAKVVPQQTPTRTLTTPLQQQEVTQATGDSDDMEISTPEKTKVGRNTPRSTADRPTKSQRKIPSEEEEDKDMMTPPALKTAGETLEFPEIKETQEKEGTTGVANHLQIIYRWADHRTFAPSGELLEQSYVQQAKSFGAYIDEDDRTNSVHEVLRVLAPRISTALFPEETSYTKLSDAQLEEMVRWCHKPRSTDKGREAFKNAANSKDL